MLLSPGGGNNLSPGYLCCMQIPGHVTEYSCRHLMSDLFNEIATTHCCGKANSIILILGISFLARVMRIMQIYLYWVFIVSVCQCWSEVLLGHVDTRRQSCTSPHAFPALLLTCLQLLLFFDLELQYPNPPLYCQGCLLPTHPL